MARASNFEIENILENRLAEMLLMGAERVHVFFNTYILKIFIEIDSEKRHVGFL